MNDEFEEKLFERANQESDSDGDIKPFEVVETPEMKKARENVNRILNDMMARQQAELDANKFNVMEVQSSKEINVGDAKVTDNYLSKFDADRKSVV